MKILLLEDLMKNTYSAHLLLLVMFCGMTASQNNKRKNSNEVQHSNKKEKLITTHENNEQKNIVFNNLMLTEDDVQFENIDGCIDQYWKNHEGTAQNSFLDIAINIAKQTVVDQIDVEQKRRDFFLTYSKLPENNKLSFERLCQELGKINPNLPAFQVYEIGKEVYYRKTLVRDIFDGTPASNIFNRI